MAARPTYTTQPTQRQHYVHCCWVTGPTGCALCSTGRVSGWLMCVLLQRLQAVLRASLEQPCNVLCTAAGYVAGICRRGKPEGQRHDAPATAPVVQVLRVAVLLRTWVASRCAVRAAVTGTMNRRPRVRASARASAGTVCMEICARARRPARSASAARRAPTTSEGAPTSQHAGHARLAA